MKFASALFYSVLSSLMIAMTFDIVVNYESSTIDFLLLSVGILTSLITTVPAIFYLNKVFENELKNDAIKIEQVWNDDEAYGFQSQPVRPVYLKTFGFSDKDIQKLINSKAQKILDDFLADDN